MAGKIIGRHTVPWIVGLRRDNIVCTLADLLGIVLLHGHLLACCTMPLLGRHPTGVVPPQDYAAT